MNKIFYIANWKMNKTVIESKSFIETFLSSYQKSEDKDIVLCPSVIALSKLGNFEGISFGAQNVNEQKSGAYTGEISVGMLKELNIKYCIVGHSERRALYKETDNVINDKIKLLVEANITPILCIGETWEQRQDAIGEEIVSNQLSSCLDGLEACEIIIAYEPIWAIGTGLSANLEDISCMNTVIKKQMNKLGYMDDQFYILYGGSVNINNVKVLKSAEYIGGFLIGGASLEADNFLDLIKR